MPDMPEDALFSLVAGEGDGFLLGMAAGDAAGASSSHGYSSVTEQATLVSYHLINNDPIRVGALVDEMLDLDGGNGGEPVYRGETPSFRRWLDGATGGNPTPVDIYNFDGVARSAPIGVRHRTEPEALIEATLAVAAVFDRDARSIAASVVAATAVAASCFAQSGRDLLNAVGDAIDTVVSAVSEGVEGVIHPETLPGMAEKVKRLPSGSGLREAREALAFVCPDGDPGPMDQVLASLLLAAPVDTVRHRALEQSARLGGSVTAAFAGALVGARHGIRAWPWPFPNDTWFAEIGRRLVRGPRETQDLPIPYAVEQHLMTGARPGFH